MCGAMVQTHPVIRCVCLPRTIRTSLPAVVAQPMRYAVAKNRRDPAPLVCTGRSRRNANGGVMRTHLSSGSRLAPESAPSNEGTGASRGLQRAIAGVVALCIVALGVAFRLRLGGESVTRHLDDLAQLGAAASAALLAIVAAIRSTGRPRRPRWLLQRRPPLRSADGRSTRALRWPGDERPPRGPRAPVPTRRTSR